MSEVKWLGGRSAGLRGLRTLGGEVGEYSSEIAGKTDECEWLLRGLRGSGLDFDGVVVTVVEAGRLGLEIAGKL